MKKNNIGKTFELKDQATISELPSIEVKLKIREPSEEIKYLMKEIFNMKFNYDTLLNFTCQLLSHEQHVKFAAKKKEIFG